MVLLLQSLVFFLRMFVTLCIYRHLSGYPIKLFWITIVSCLYTALACFLRPLAFFMLLGMMLTLSIYFDRLKNLKMELFYSFYPIVVNNLFRYVIVFVLLPGIGLSAEYRISDMLLASVLVYPMYYLVMRVIKVDFETLRLGLERNFSYQFIYLANFVMVVYFFLVSCICFFSLSELENRDYLVVLNLTYIFLFFMMLVYINVTFKELLEKEMKWQKDRQIQDLSNYSHQIESLYSEVRRFRHDYLNLLSSLEIAIENEDINAIRSVYEGVLKGTGECFKSSKYSLANLANIENDAVKSILSAKLIQAQDKGITTSVEVSSSFTDVPIDLVDFITLLSIFMDNAIEAAKVVEEAKISLALIQREDKQIVIIENSIQEESHEVHHIFQEGYSTKGDGRGIGLSTVSTILGRYPEVTLKTVSQNHTFRQTLEI